jgi:hypothetical protein
MTALKEYERLETLGLWRPSRDDQLREVVISFGSATLVIADTAGRPLTHWSLPAVERLNPGTRPAQFSPDPTGTETLEIEDATMIDAIEKVRKSLLRRRARPGRLRRGTIWAGVGVFALIALFWLPEALLRQALSSIPAGKRSEIGATLLGHIQRVTGPACRDPVGTQALRNLKDRVLGPAAPGQIIVLPDDIDTALYLPGGLIVVSRRLIEQTDDPALIAGHVLASATSRSASDPLLPLLRQAGFGATVTLLTTGDLPPEAIQRNALYVLTNPAPVAAGNDLLLAFDLAKIPLGPWAQEQGMPDLATEAADQDAEAEPILSDSDWVSLQGVCAGQE